MDTKPNHAKNIDEYIASFPAPVQQLLQQVRATVAAAAPDATETISYGMPAFKQNGILVYFAGYKNHIGFYPAPIGMKAFEKELSVYKTGKGSVQFPLDKPLPLELITRMVELRTLQNMEKGIKKG